MNWQIVFYMEPLLYTSPNISKMLVCESLFLIVVVRALSLSLCLQDDGSRVFHPLSGSIPVPSEPAGGSCSHSGKVRRRS